MKARLPTIDFKEVSPHWASSIEFAQSLNAGSIAAPHVEAYLNVALARAIEELGSADEELKNEISVFRDQESNHLRLHSMFNRRLYDSGYRDVRRFEDDLKADLKRFL